LVALLTLIAASPLASQRYLQRAAWELMFTVIMLSSIYVLSLNRRQTLVGVVLAVPALTSMWSRLLAPSSVLTQATPVLIALFLLYTAIMLVGHVFRAPTVTMDTLAGACCVYLLIGLLWGTIYITIYALSPDAFQITYQPRGGGDNFTAGSEVPVSALMYFSFVTLTTVGFGDVVPVDPVARAAMILEALIGQFYLVVLVARLVGMHIVDMRR
jgi:hypothetical protein